MRLSRDEHPAGTRLLLKHRTNPYKDLEEVTILEWSPQERVKLRGTNATGSVWLDHAEIREHKVLEVLPPLPAPVTLPPFGAGGSSADVMPRPVCVPSAWTPAPAPSSGIEFYPTRAGAALAPTRTLTDILTRLQDQAHNSAGAPALESAQE